MRWPGSEATTRVAIETTVELLPVDPPKDISLAGEGRVLMHPRFNAAPSDGWKALFQEALVEAKNDLLANAGLKFEGLRIEYVTDLPTDASQDALNVRKLEDIRSLVAVTNRKASAQNEREASAQKEDDQRRSDNQLAFERFRKRMAGK